jgi:hypothetical protein
MSLVQKKQTRSSRLKELRTTFSGISYGTTNTSLPSYSSYQAYLGSDASPYLLCFDTYFDFRVSSFLTRRLFTTIIADNPDRFPVPSVTDQWNCQGYRDPWRIKGSKSEKPSDEGYSVGKGYLFSALRKQSSCNRTDPDDVKGPGIFAVFQTASQINALNNPKSNVGFGSVSKFILDYATANYATANSTTLQNLLPNLFFDEDIFYVEPTNSPFTISSSDIRITITTKERVGNVNSIFGTVISNNYVTNTSNIPLENFNFKGTSSQPSVATSSFYTPGIIEYVSSGTFVLTITQLFSQSAKDKVIYSEGSPFNVTVNLYLLPSL